MKNSKYMQNNAINVFFWATLGGAFVSMLCLLAIYLFNDTYFDAKLTIFSDFVEIMNEHFSPSM